MKTLSKTDTEAYVKRTLDVLINDVTLATRAFHAWETIQIIKSQNKRVIAKLRRNPYFWTIVPYALQCTYIIYLARLFDNSTKYNLRKLIETCQAEPGIFTREALAGRQRQSGMTPAQASEYAAKAHIPTAGELQRMMRRFETIEARAQKYKKIRHEVFAHPVRTSQDEISPLLKDTKGTEIEALLAYSWRTVLSINDLFVNGHKPCLRAYSLLEKKSTSEDTAKLMREYAI